MKKLFALALAVMLLAAAGLTAIAERATAWLLYTPVTGWPENTSPAGNDNIVTTNASVTGEGYYTVGITYQYPWTSTDGAQRLHVVVDGGQALFPGMYMQVTDVRVDGESIPCGSVSYGPMGYDSGYADEDDSYGVLYDQYFVDNNVAPQDHATWDGSELQSSAMDQADIPYGGMILEVDFFLSALQGIRPPEHTPQEFKPVWFSMNTVGLAGLSLKDLGIDDDWHNIVPVDLTVDAVYSYPLVVADAHQIGTAVVIVSGGYVSVHCSYADGEVYEKKQCIKWFTSLDQLNAAELTSIKGGLHNADVVSIADDLGGAEIAYLSINNKVNFRLPITNSGAMLPQYYRNMPSWVSWRELLTAMLPK